MIETLTSLTSVVIETATAIADGNSSVPVIVDPVAQPEGNYFLVCRVRVMEG